MINGQAAFRSRWRDRHGLALVATLVVLVVMIALVATAVRAVMTMTRASGFDYHEARAFYAAEAGAEAALARLRIALQDGYLSDAELRDVGPPTLEDFSFDSFSIGKQGAAVVEQITDGPYTGLYSLTQNVEVFSLAADRNGTVGGVMLNAKAQAIPIFQFGVFFEQDLEATNGPPLDFAGRVHSNGNIYLSSRNAWYRELVTTPNKIFHDRKDFHSVFDGVYINDASGNEVSLDFDSRSIPGADAFQAQSCSRFDCRLQTDAFAVDSLRLPLPDGVPPVELVRPREAGDGPAERSSKFAWKADTYVTVDLSRIEEVDESCVETDDDDDEDDNGWWPQITIERDRGPTPNAFKSCKIFRWEWSAFYDGREDELKDALNLDIVELDAWTVGEGARPMEIIYIDFRNPTGIDAYPEDARERILDGQVDPALRVVNGADIPNRLTVATEWPVYVRGDYNSVPGAKEPAALVGDGITLLSAAWSDDSNRPSEAIFDECEDRVFQGSPCGRYETWKSGWSYRDAAETTVNAAILAGHWPTPCDHEAAGCSGGYQDFYGGGIENFPRFLERWRDAGGNPVTLHYRGSLVSPFTSQKTTGTWNGSYYVPPRRDWSFDTDFRDPALLPPGTPNVGNVVRTAMREAF